MRFVKFCAGLLLAGVTGAGWAANDAPIDNRLVGVWEGQRETNQTCKFQARTVERLPDGRYVITYYADPGHTRKIGEVKGLWWAQDRTLFLQSPGSSGKPEAYRYYMIDKNTVRLENTDIDLTAECQEDNTQIDSRVVMQQE
ncbi:MAG TPA: hypothetical protein VFM48_12685 [Aquabacterium sp.]|nr:hypothetical protein [Aquabacterium sp.]